MDNTDETALGAKVPVTEEVPQRLNRGALGLLDITAATMANIAPAMSFFFGFGYLAFTAGLASPLTILLAGIAILFLGNTLSEFTKVLPSTGGFITFVGKTFGARTAVTTALLTGTGYIAAMASVIAIVGGFFQGIMQHYNVSGLESVPWGVYTLIFLAIAAYMMIRGVSISTKVAGLFFSCEMAILLIVSVVTLAKFHQHINFRPFEPKNISGGFKGLAAGFPLGIYLFIGWENSAALAEETNNPRKNVPRAVFTSIFVMLVAYLLFAYSTVVGFKDNVTTLTSSPVPFLTVAGAIGAFVLFLTYVAGMTSTMGAMIAGTNSQARLLFNAGREGLLPKTIGAVYQKRRTPVHALMLFLGIGVAIIGFWGLGHLIGGNPHGSVTGPLAYQGMSALTMYDESATFGAFLVLLVYGLSNLALPFYYKRYHPELFNMFRHGVLPIVGAAIIIVPIYYLCKPPLAPPYSWYPWMALGAVILAVIYASVLVKRDSTVGDRVGSLVADE